MPIQLPYDPNPENGNACPTPIRKKERKLIVGKSWANCSCTLRPHFIMLSATTNQDCDNHANVPTHVRTLHHQLFQSVPFTIWRLMGPNRGQTDRRSCPCSDCCNHINHCCSHLVTSNDFSQM